MSMNQSNVKFVYTTRTNYDAISEIKGGTLYYLHDEKVIMLNGHQYGFNTTELDSAISNYITSEVLSLKGVAEGFASLGEDGKIPTGQLPSYVDDVVEAANLTGLNNLATKETGKIYVAKDTNKTYRWGGSDFVEISSSLAIGTTASTAYAGNLGKALRDDFDAHELDKDNPHNVTKAQLDLGNVNNTSDLNKPISNATQIALNQKASKEELLQQASDLNAKINLRARIEELSATNTNVGRNFNQINQIKQTLTWDLTGSTNNMATSWVETTVTTQIVGSYTTRPSATEFMTGDVIKVETTTYETQQTRRVASECPVGQMCFLDTTVTPAAQVWYETTYVATTTDKYWLAQ